MAQRRATGRHEGQHVSIPTWPGWAIRVRSKHCPGTNGRNASRCGRRSRPGSAVPKRPNEHQVQSRQVACVRPTDARSTRPPICFGHIDRGIERQGVQDQGRDRWRLICPQHPYCVRPRRYERLLSGGGEIAFTNRCPSLNCLPRKMRRRVGLERAGELGFGAEVDATRSAQALPQPRKPGRPQGP
jgi:hypothetical protein